MKYYAIYESNMSEKEIVKYIRKQTDIPGKCKLMYLGVIENEDEIEEFIDEQRVDYEHKKRLN